MISYYTEDQVETEQIIPVSWQPEFEDFVVPKDLLQQQSFRTKNMYS